LVESRAQSAFPFGTLVVNLLGCFAAGFLFQTFEHIALPMDLRLTIFTGFLGGFTTFSAYALQGLVLTRNGMSSLALINVVASNGAGLALVWIGAAASRVIISPA
jgi:CrcB protein